MTDLWISPMILERLAGSLLHFVWQGAAIAILAALALRLLERRPAEWRYAATSIALLTMLAAPIVTFVFYSQTGALALGLLGGLNGAATTAAAEASATDVAIWTQRIVSLWLVGVGACLIRLTGGWILSCRLVRSATDVVAPTVTAAMETARAALALDRPVRLLAGVRIEAPVVIGWLRPAILLPASALTGLDPDHLLAILAHELAHVRRHDFLVNAMQRFVECVLFYHPAVWWVSGRIRVERERCCDDPAVRVCGDRLLYAQALIALEKTRAAEPLLAVPATGGAVIDRVRRILGAGSAQRDWQSAVAALFFVAILFGAGMWQPPVLAGPSVPLAAPAPVPPPVVAPPPAPPAPLGALAAIVTAQRGQAPVATQPQAPAPKVTQPTIAAAREAARKELGALLRLDYSADAFVKQAGEGDTIAVKTFLAAGMNIEEQDTAGLTALAKAAQMRRTETVQSLLAAGANPNLAVIWNRIEHYLDGGVQKERNVPEWRSALYFAAENGDLATMKVLLAAGADVNLKLLSGATALDIAASQGHRDAVSLLLDNKATLDLGFNPTILSASCGNGVLQLLVERGANINASFRNSKSTPLHQAVRCPDTENMKVLLAKGADINAVDEGGYTPLAIVLLGASNKPRDLTRARATLLIERGADIKMVLTKGNPLEGIARVGLTDIVRTLIDNGAAVNGSNNSSAVMAAIQSTAPSADQLSTVILLLERGADVRGALPEAVQRGQAEIVRALLAKGADPNARVPTPGSPTLLQVAKGKNNAAIVQLLLDAGAKP